MKKRVMLFLLIIFTLIFIPSFVFAGEKEELLNLINGERANKGLSPLNFHSSLNTAAQLHSEDLLAQNYFSHPSLDGRTPWDRMQDAGFVGTYYGENIAAHTGVPNADICFNSWMNSPAHYSNMMNANFNFAGIGIAEGNWYYSNFNGAYSSIYTLTLGKQNIVCSSGETKQCGTSDIGECSFGTQECVDGVWTQCNAVYPVVEICNNSLDDDCDGLIDDYCNCLLYNYSLCYNNYLYWYDSCDRLQEKKEDCRYGCLNNECRICENHSQYKCYGADVYWYNSCDMRQERKQDCRYGCSNNECNPAPCLDNDRDGFKNSDCGGEDCDDFYRGVNPNSQEICNDVDENCNGVVDEDCQQNLIIVNPAQNAMLNLARPLAELKVLSLKGYVLYSLNGLNWYSFCSTQGVCKSYLSLKQGINEVKFRATDNSGKQHNASLILFVDSIRPIISSQEPRNGAYANGTFKVKYSEINLKEVNLYLAEYGSIPVKIASGNDCLSGTNKECLIQYDLSALDGKQIKYYFELADNNLKTISSNYIVKVDKTAPIILNFSFNKTSLIYNKYLMKIQVNEKSNIFYNLPESSLSSICSGCTSTSKYFSFLNKPAYIDFTIKDMAGNVILRREVL